MIENTYTVSGMACGRCAGFVTFADASVVAG